MALAIAIRAPAQQGGGGGGGPPPPGSFDFYISTTGSDSNPGTLISPWALTAINSKRATYAGKKVGLLPGTYNCLLLIGGSYTGDFATPAFNIAGGTITAQTVIAASQSDGTAFTGAPGFTAGVWNGPILSGSATSGNNTQGQPLLGSIGNGSGGGVAGAGYITIDGLEMKGGFNRTLSIGGQTGNIPGTRTKGIIVQNNYAHGQTNSLTGANSTAITIYASDGAIVQNNRITDLADTTSRACGIEAWASINTIVQYNTIISTSNQHHGGIEFKNAAQNNNTIRYNYINLPFQDGSGGATTAIGGDSDGNGSTTFAIKNNVVIADQGASAFIISTGAFPDSANKQLWANNTFLGIPNNPVGCLSRFGAAATITIYNNIINRGTTGGRGDIDVSTSSLAQIDYNCYPAVPQLGLTVDHNGSAYPTSLTSSLATWGTQVPSGCIGKDAHSATTNSPGFVGSGSEAAFYKLTPGSTCSATGTKPGSSDGTTGGTPTDMGAWGGIDVNTGLAPAQIGSNF